MSKFLKKISMSSSDDMNDDESVQMMTVPKYALPENGDAAVGLWRQKMSAGILNAMHFREYWKTTVPKVYVLELNGNCLDWSFNEEHVHALLLSPLEKFICGSDDPQEALQNLAQLDRPPSVCGRVFKVGEPAYICRECGMDNTCVLCVDCFKRSAHRHHKYKMGNSSGGGCCDCGDIEAWKNDPYCDVHIIGTLPQEVPQGLPEDLSARTKETFAAALSYCYQMLTLEPTRCLPNDLRIKDGELDPLLSLEPMDCFCTVLYNDETHTFEQVITTLTRVIKCSQRDAIEYVTNIDREGRAVVKCASLQHCNELRSEIEKYTSKHGNRSLKVHVVQNHVIAHQIFAMRLLQWIQNFVVHAEGFRRILSLTALAPRPPDVPVAEGILIQDCHLWKSARTAWHRLLIAGMLVDYDSKKSLATVFTKNYGTVIKDFIRDDHDHAFSVSSLSVQIYTIPTLAHHLIAHEDALFILLTTFVSECSRKCNKNDKLEFERNVSNTTFKRAQFILYDLKYLLSCKPEVWTDPLRKGFIGGLSWILKLLTMMQGMDAVVRQIGQHMEFEPEWESAFNLHIKLATVISLALEWCGSDKVILVKAYRMTLHALHNSLANEVPNSVIRELVDHSATCIHYDVASQPVSIHLPLSRFLAGLHLHLHKYGLTFDSHEFQMTKPTPEQIIEPVLRTQAMIAQVHAGMWRRNGYALLNQLYFYHNVKCRSEMLDRDIILLQVGASLIERNEFIIHLLNKFNLINWAHPEFEKNSLKSPEEDSMRQTMSLVEEFLGLLITIIGERHVPGVGEVTVDERTKKEIIQQLCVSSLTHSELNRTLPEDQLHETGMENVIDEVAEFKKPSNGKGCGVYSLRSHLFSEYNVFFYHYTREELSKSEEVQRKRRKTAGELECCPPPDMPRLTPAFSMLADLLQCDVMLHIMQIVLMRSCELLARSFSEMQLHKVLHLIGMALQEQESGRYPYLVFTERANRYSIPSLLVLLQKSTRVDAHRDLLTWTLNKYRSVAAIDINQTNSSKETSNTTTTTTTATESSTSESVLALQESEKEWRAKMAAQKRAKVMAQMLAMQNNFMKENAKLFEESENGSQSSSSTKKMSENDMYDEIKMDVSEQNCKLTWGRKFGIRKVYTERTHTCILCQEDTQISMDGPPLVLAGFVQQSTVLMQNRTGQTLSATSGLPCLIASLGPAPHVSTCGHVMHGQCWQKYYDNVVNKENRRPYRLRQPAAFNVEKQEFLCPLCECLSNTVLPLIPSLESSQCDESNTIIENEDITFDEWIFCLQAVLKLKVSESAVHECNETCSDLHCSIHAETSSSSPPPPFLTNTYYSCHISQIVKELGNLGKKFTILFPLTTPQFDEKPKDFIQLFALAMYTRGLGIVDPHTGDPRVVTVAWASAAYTLLTVEANIAEAGKPLLGHLSSRHRDCLQALIRIVGILGTVSVKQEVVSSHALQLLTPFLGARNSNEPSIFDWDSFGYLLALTMSLPSLFINESEMCSVPKDSIMGFYTLKLVFLINIVKIMLTSEFSHCAADVKMEDGEDIDNCVDLPVIPDCTRLLETLKRVRKNIDTTNLNEGLVWNVIKKACHTFLRSCCLFYHFLTDTPAPLNLTELGGDTFENMCAFLNLPDKFDKIFDTQLTYDLALEWSSHQEVCKYLSGQTISVPIVKEPRAPCTLVSLPNDYSELINMVSSFTCPNSDREDSRNPTMCLVCGDMLCSQSYCCQEELNKTSVGACTYHAHTCGAGVGIFLRVRECEILLLAPPSKGCVIAPPYVDQYGETDQGLRRGNPLHLCEETYNKLQMLWLGHGIHEEIARSIESANNILNPNWQNL